MKKLILSVGILCISVGLSYAQTTSNVLRGGIVVNEFLFNPDFDFVFDTDGDGVYSESDEFIELFNTSTSAINLNGIEIWDPANGIWFTFPDITLAPGKFAVVLMKVNSGGSLPELSEGNIAFNANTTELMDNQGDNIYVYDPVADEYLHIVYNEETEVNPVTISGFSATATVAGAVEDFGINTQGGSLTRYPDGDSNVVVHNSMYTAPASPGTSPLFYQITGSAGWRMLSFPITGGAVSDLSDDTAIQGVAGGDYENAEPNFYTYDDSGVYEVPTDVNSPVSDGSGFITYFFDNNIAGSSELPLILDVTGQQPEADVWVDLNSGASNKFTLVGNPFSKSIRSDFMYATGGWISQQISFWDNELGSYVIKTRSDGDLIKPWKSFWVETLDERVHSITLPISARVITGYSSTDSQNKKGAVKPDISFTLSSESTYDEAIKLSFRSNGSFAEVDTMDATKLVPLTSSFATMAFKSGDHLKSVETIPDVINEEIILDLEPQFAGVEGEFTFAWEGMETIPSEWEVTLHDRKLGTFTDLKIEDEYTFEAHQVISSKMNPLTILKQPTAKKMKSNTERARFGLIIMPNESTVNNEPRDQVEKFALEQNYPNPFNPNTTISYSVDAMGPVSLTIHNLMGQKVAELVNETKNTGSYNVVWNAANFASGVYYYRLNISGRSLTRKMTLIK